MSRSFASLIELCLPSDNSRIREGREEEKKCEDETRCIEYVDSNSALPATTCTVHELRIQADNHDHQLSFEVLRSSALGSFPIQCISY